MAEGVSAPNGIKIGDGRAHVGLIARIGYDSAAGYFGPTSTTATLGGDLVVTPALNLSYSLDTAATAVNFRGSAGYVWYTGAISPGARDLSHVTAAVGLDTAFNKSGAVEFQIGDNFARSNRSSNVAAGVGLISLFNSVYVAAPVHPGGGALSVTPKVRWDVEFFSAQLPSTPATCGMGSINCDPSLVQNMNYSNLNFGLGAKWRFLPKTAAVLDASFDYRLYFNRQRTALMPTPDPTSNLPAYLLKVSTGLSGLITSHISTLLLVGGGGDWGGSNSATFLAQAEIAWLGSILTARGGYLRTLAPVPIFGVFGQDRGYAEIKSALFGRLSLRGFGAVDYITYWAGSTARDLMVTATAEISFQFVSIFSAALTYNLLYRSTLLGAPGFIRHEPFLTLNLTY